MKEKNRMIDRTTDTKSTMLLPQFLDTVPWLYTLHHIVSKIMHSLIYYFWIKTFQINKQMTNLGYFPLIDLFMLLNVFNQLLLLI